MSLYFEKRRGLLVILTALACSMAGVANAQTNSSWPDKPIKIIVGYSAGGATDILARLVAVKMGTTLGQSVIVENKPGANSNVGAELVARSPADGYTLYAFSIANTINMSLYPKLGYDALKDFMPVTLGPKTPNIFTVNPSVTAKNLPELIELAKKSPFNYASSGIGTTTHLSMERLKTAAKIDIVHGIVLLVGIRIEQPEFETVPLPVKDLSDYFDHNVVVS